MATWLHRLKNELDSCAAFLFRLMDYCFGTLTKERNNFLCSVLVSAHGLKNELDSCVAFLFRLKDYCFGTLIKERVKFLFSARLNS